MTEFQNESCSLNDSLLNFQEVITKPVVSVVIVNYNGEKFLKKCLEGLLIQTYLNIEIIIVDNASTDNSVEYLKSFFKELIIIVNSSNLGFAGGVNTGIRKAQGALIMTLNNDTWPDSNCVERLVSEMTSDDHTGMCAAKMLFPDTSINSAGIFISRSGAAWDRGKFEADKGQYNSREEIFGPCAGAALYRRKMLDEIGLFDEDFFLYMEDVDLAFRAHLAGWKCIYVPEAVVYHYHGGTAGFMSDLTVYYGNRNILWYTIKNYPLKTLLTSLPWIIGRNLATIPYYAFKGQGKVIFQSKIDGIIGIPKMWAKRRLIRMTVKASEINRFF
jgi:GT2 family glycosyltransferase